MRNERLRALLLERGKTPDQLAEAVRVDAKTVERWITKGRLPYRRYRFEAASFLGVDESYIWPARWAATRSPWCRRARSWRCGGCCCSQNHVTCGATSSARIRDSSALDSNVTFRPSLTDSHVSASSRPRCGMISDWGGAGLRPPGHSVSANEVQRLVRQATSPALVQSHRSGP